VGVALKERTAGYLIHKADRLVRARLASSLRVLGLTPQQAGVLLTVSELSAEGCTPADVSEAVDADDPTISGVLSRLSRDGWLSSQRNPADGRSRLLVLSDAAQQALPSVVAATKEAAQSAMSPLSVDERTQLVVLLSRLTEEEPPAGNQTGRSGSLRAVEKAGQGAT